MFKSSISIGTDEFPIVGACGMTVQQYNRIKPENRHIINGQCFAFIKNSIKDGWHTVNLRKKAVQVPIMS